MGQFIAIEGGDGSGKATQSKLLAEYAREKGYDVLELSFPQYGSDSAYYVEQYLNGKYGESTDVPAEIGALPYAIDRFAAKDKIEAHIAKPNSLIISDRYIASNLAHQGAKINDKDTRLAFYERTKITEYSVLGVPKPDKNIVLIVPTEHMQANVDKKDARSYTESKRDIHEADANHLENAKSNFEELCRLFPEEFKAINCSQNSEQRSIEDVFQSIVEVVSL